MNYPQFIALVDSRASATGTSGASATGRESLEDLRDLVKAYPYFQTARLLYARALGPDELSGHDQRLAAIYAGDRKQLRILLENQQVVSHVSSESIAAASSGETNTPFLKETAEDERLFRPATAEEEGVFSHVNGPSVFLPPTEKERVVQATSPVPPPITPAPDSSSIGDPHDIIRRRLEEIFAARPAAEAVPPSPPPVMASESVLPEVSETTQPETSSHSNVVEMVEAKDETETVANVVALRAGISSGAEEVLIRREYMQLKDEVDREELAHAAEETALHAIENMPVSGGALSFSDWLRRFSELPYGAMEEVHDHGIAITTIQPGDNTTSSAPSSSQAQLIERFIATEPRITPSKAEFYSPALQARRSVEEDDDLVTETLAGIYLEQGMLAKARHTYQKLSLLFPEKSSSFAALIQKIDHSLNNTEE